MEKQDYCDFRWACILFLSFILVSCGVLDLPTPASESGPPKPTNTPPDSGSVTVNITNEELNQFENIVVRVLDTNQVDTKADDGKLILQSCWQGQLITAWAPGYNIATQACDNRTTPYEFTLTPYHVSDNTYYSWMEARDMGQRNCGHCHNGTQPGMEEYLEYIEWQRDGHSTTFTDYRFWTMYLGSNIYGNPGQNTEWDISDESRHVRKIPNINLPYYGPGFKTDYLSNNGNCAYCHAPASVSAPQIEVDLVPIINSSRSNNFSASTEGVNCDVCHKVLNVNLDPNTKKPYLDKPGVLSFDFIRDEPIAQRLYVGPLPGTNTIGTDINVTCSPVFSESEFCAPCHYSQFWGMQIYNSYGEWSASPYANKDNAQIYKTCQSCHMISNGKTPKENSSIRIDQREACSDKNVDLENFSHDMLQRGNDNIPDLVTNAAKIELNAKKADDKLEVEVQVTNVEAGHNFPTDSPLRHLILFVDARAENNITIPQISGPVIPPWGGVGTGPLDYAGKPGEIYANILMDRDTNQSPTVAYWDPTSAAWDESDTRLKPFTPQTSKYTFAVPKNGSAIITVKLIYRYAFIDIVRIKEWDKALYYQPDIEVVSAKCSIDPDQPVECKTTSP
jgi:hypothetical protein